MSLEQVSFACLSMDSSTCADIVCGVSGLPLTPNSIKIIGDFKAHIEQIQHPSLTQYVECFRNKNERVILVFEHLPHQPPKHINVAQAARQLLNALSYIHNVLQSVHGLITPASLVWTHEGHLKLTHWPIHLLTGGGAALEASSILPPNVSYLAPELVRAPKTRATQQSDVWSACLSLLKLIKPTCTVPESPCGLAFCDSAEQVLKLIGGRLDESHSIDQPDRWNAFFLRALQPNPETRATVEELLEMIDAYHTSQPLNTTNHIQMKSLSSTSENNCSNTTKQLKSNRTTNLDLREIYYLWRLSIGRNFESEQKQDDCPPIFKIPYLIVSDKPASSNSAAGQQYKLKNALIIDTRSKVIPLDKFKEDINGFDDSIFDPLILDPDEITLNFQRSQLLLTFQSDLTKEECNNNNNGNAGDQDNLTFATLRNFNSKSPNLQSSFESSKVLPILIKEADFAYQCHRILLFKKLISGCPPLREPLLREAAIDIPPYYRAQTWSILLNICQAESEALYTTIDKTTPVATDRQISVDIPRCHQYNELMASPQGHQKLARILKTWLNHNSEEYVYWQGLDSLAAPFLLLNFHNEAVAFACFNAFVNKYLKGFFKKDNQLIVQQYLAQFSELLSFHDPALANHLDSLAFLPNLYAIPWFLTMFTHVLPLHKILHVWDCLLLSDEKFPLCIGLAILNQLREELLEFNFNDCIVVFSDLPEINIEKCIRDATYFYNSTPDKLISLS